jgi:hypothetical protein
VTSLLTIYKQNTTKKMGFFNLNQRDCSEHRQ